MNQQTQYLLASVVESSQDSIVSIDLERNITSWNKGAESLYGYRADEVMGKPLSIVLLPSDITALISKVNDIVHELNVPIYETIRVHKNGRHADLEIMLSPVRNPIGAVIGISTIARDITRRKMQEQQKDDFIAVASHELKTPVTSIKAYTEILLETFRNANDEANIAMMEKLGAQVDRLVELIKTLLDTTKLVEGQFLLKKERIDLNSLIKEQIEHIKSSSGRHTIIFNAKGEIYVRADKKLVGQVIANLISNAVKYSHNGGEIIVSSVEKDNEAEISVQDFGIGIPDEVKDRIFERYFRVDNPLVSGSLGVGLGLYITAKIVQQHGGSISVKSTEGIGSTFSFTIPNSHTAEEA